MSNIYYQYPRLYIDFPMRDNSDIPLEQKHAHYLKNVLRKETGQALRVFNGLEGEWIAIVKELDKKRGVATLHKKIKEQDTQNRKIHLIFSPIKKQRLDFVIEKAVELGVTDIHPVIMKRTENRHLNTDRIKAQMIEAAEQCERLCIPILHALVDMDKKLSSWGDRPTIYACVERSDTKELSVYSETYYEDSGFLVGPEGGFDPKEIEGLAQYKVIKPVTLGSKILRAETAALYCLSQT